MCSSLSDSKLSSCVNEAAEFLRRREASLVSFFGELLMVTRLVRGIVSVRYLHEFYMMANSTPTTPTRHSEMAHLPETLEMNPEVWREGADRMDSVSREPINHGLHFKPPVEPLLLLQATQLDGKALPRKSFTVMAVGAQVQQITGFRSINIEVVTNRDVILEFEPPTQPGETAQRLHRIREWDGQMADLGCLLTTRRSIMNLVEERENGQNRLQQLEEEQQQVRAEQREHQAQLAQFLTQF